jgi:hypothetical protein
MSKNLKVFTTEDINSMLSEAFESTHNALCTSSNYRLLMRTLDDALVTKSTLPLEKSRDEGRVEAIVYFCSTFCSHLIMITEKALNYQFSMYNLTKNFEDYCANKEFSESLRSLEPLLNAYNLANQICNSELSVPFIVQKQCIEKLSVFLQFPHRKGSSPEKLFYIQPNDLARGRLTMTKPGKWFMSNGLGIEKDALDFSTVWAATAEKIPSVFFLSELTDKGGLSEDNWEWVYENTDAKTGSCMIKCPEVARVYADNPILDIAYMTSTNEPFSGKVIARTIVRHDKKHFIRSYHIDHKVQCQFIGFLKDKGFVEERDLAGVILKRIVDKHNSANLVFPYLDGSSQYVVGTGDSNAGLEVVRNISSKSKEIGLRYMEHYSGCSSGRVSALNKCTHCSSFGRVSEKGYILAEGKQKLIKTCTYCIRSFIYDQSKRRYYSASDFKFFLSIDHSEKQYNVCQENEKIPDQYTEITCKYTLKEYTGGGERFTLENLKGEKVSCDSVLVSKKMYTKYPVSLYTGEVTDVSQCSYFDFAGFSSMKDLIVRLSRYNKYEPEADALRKKLKHLDKKKAKNTFLEFMLNKGVITQEEYNENTNVIVVPDLTVKLSDGESTVVRKHNLESGELVYDFSLSNEIKEKLWKPILSETEKLKKELDDLFKEWDAIETVVF